VSASESFIEHVKETLAGLGPVSVRRMFGGAGVFADGVMFALIADDALYLKADDVSKQAFEAEGAGPFLYESRGRTIALSYWRIPDRLLDDPDEMVSWARSALSIAHRAAPKRKAARGTARNRNKAR
jgi:DNA transformation protein and related proteins